MAVSVLAPMTTASIPLEADKKKDLFSLNISPLQSSALINCLIKFYMEWRQRILGIRGKFFTLRHLAASLYFQTILFRNSNLCLCYPKNTKNKNLEISTHILLVVIVADHLQFWPDIIAVFKCTLCPTDMK